MLSNGMEKKAKAYSFALILSMISESLVLDNLPTTRYNLLIFNLLQ